MPKEKQFASEADLCRRFVSALPEGWTAFNEVGNWDILLVRNEDGFQIGIEAKLRLNAHVISQALEEYGSFYADGFGPDCRAVLVPDGDAGGFGLICKYIGVTIITVKSAEQCEESKRRFGSFYYDKQVFSPRLPGDDRGNEENWHEWAPSRRHPLPDYVPDVDAGHPSPMKLTDWKIGAIKIAIIMEKRGYLTRSDFKHVRIDHRRWLPSATGWLKLDRGVYRAAPGFPDFRKQHPRNYEQIAADYEKWAPKDEGLPLAPRPEEPMI